ncbi:MAG: hypothetical protein HYT62_02510 [Candidatus Yanofskybacteria bacterium]|nr:hypothetical protein [Candidatus Yanofskybacteria bacterium]
MIFDDLPDNLDLIEEEVVRRFRLLRRVVFEVLPSDCLLKPRNVLTGAMAGSLDIDMVQNGFVEGGDICAICLENKCPHFRIDNRAVRVLKIEKLKDFGRMQ